MFRDSEQMGTDSERCLYLCLSVPSVVLVCYFREILRCKTRYLWAGCPHPAENISESLSRGAASAQPSARHWHPAASKPVGRRREGSPPTTARINGVLYRGASRWQHGSKIPWREAPGWVRRMARHPTAPRRSPRATCPCRREIPPGRAGWTPRQPGPCPRRG